MDEILKNRHHFLDLVQVAFFLTDVHSKILYVNRYAERLFGYLKEEMEGQRIRLLFLEEDLTYFLPNILYLTLYQSGFEGEGLLRQREGKKVFVYLSTTSFKEEGEVFLTFSFQEIQRLKTLERQKLEMEHWASLGMMVEEIAHQVRNPIVSIGGYTQRLLKQPLPSPRGKFYLGKILEESKRLERMIHRLEEVMLVQRPVPEKEKIIEVVEEALKTLSQEAGAKGITIHLETGTLSGEESFFVDRELVTKALYHLLENSLEAIGQASRGKTRKGVKVVLTCEEGNAVISISDQGEGVSKKNLRHLFDPFFSTRPHRIGLGLTFVKRVVEEHGGKIRLESRPKRGMTVTLMFPMDRRRKIRREWLSPEVKNSLSTS